MQFDITRSADGIDKTLAYTVNPRHRFILLSYKRHLLLEMSGRYDEIFVPEMTVEHPVYRFHALGLATQLEGVDQIRALYRSWAETNQTNFYAENTQVAVADNFVATRTIAYQQVWGPSVLGEKVLGHLPKCMSKPLLLTLLNRHGFHPKDECYYLYKSLEETIWPYDDRCRLMSENVWEPEPKDAQLIKLNADQVLTTAQVREKLAPMVEPLPNFDEYVLGKKAAGA